VGLVSYDGAWFDSSLNKFMRGDFKIIKGLKIILKWGSPPLYLTSQT
jgi:hypothetical protein